RRAMRRIAPALREVGQEGPRPFDRVEGDAFEAGLLALFRELVRFVEVGGREVAELARLVPVLAVREVALDDGRERGIVEDAAGAQAVEQRGEARDAGGEDGPARPQHAAGLAPGAQPLLALRQVIERAEKEHR